MKYLKQEIKILISRISGNYIINSPKGDKEKYLELFSEAKKFNYPLIDSYLKGKSKVDENWFNDLVLHTQITIKKSKLNFQHGKILYALLTEYLEKYKSDINILETGTARGFSSIVMSKVLNEKNLKNSKIYTLDIIPHNKKIYWNCIDDLEGRKTRKNLLSSWKDLTENIEFLTGRSKYILPRLKELSRINFAFLDGAHDYKTVKFEFLFVSKRQKKNDIMVLDDVTKDKFNGIVELVNEIKSNDSYDVQLIQSESNRGYAILKRK